MGWLVLLCVAAYPMNFRDHVAALKIAGVNVCVGIVWVFITDFINDIIFTKQLELLFIVSTIKGVFYVTVTSILIYVLVDRAVTAIKRERELTEIKLEEMNRTLEQKIHQRTLQVRLANQELREFSNNVSSQLLAPVGDIITSLRQLRQRCVGIDMNTICSTTLVAIETLLIAVKETINDLLSLSRLNKLNLHLRPVNMTLLVKSVIDHLEPKDSKILWRVDNLPVVYGDLGMLHIAVDHLLTNAIKFSKDSDPVRIHIGSRRDEPISHPDMITFFVRDNGIGFDMAAAGRLFTPFMRLHGNAYLGTGIGLAIVKGIIERHRGRVWAKSVPHLGATFYFTLPQLPVGPVQEMQESPPDDIT